MWSPMSGPGLPPIGTEWSATFESRGFGYRMSGVVFARGAQGVPHYWRGSGEGAYTSGWPWQMLKAHVGAVHDESGRALSGWELPVGEMLKRGFPTNRLPRLVHARAERRIPMSPLWLGFAANTVFWSVACGVGAYVLGRTRRAMRRRKSQCASCGYDLRGLDPSGKCPECGKQS
jgi:hypothetical protein